MTEPKIYRVAIAPAVTAVPTIRYVRAHTKAGAIRHVAADSISARIPSQDELVRHVTTHGATAIEDATGETDDGANNTNPE